MAGAGVSAAYIISEEQFYREASEAVQDAVRNPQLMSRIPEWHLPIDFENPTFHQLLETYAKPKGAERSCPRDKVTKGCSLVDALRFEEEEVFLLFCDLGLRTAWLNAEEKLGL